MPGAPQALLADGKVWYAAAHDPDGNTGHYPSVDSGASWKLYYRDPA